MSHSALLDPLMSLKSIILLLYMSISQIPIQRQSLAFNSIISYFHTKQCLCYLPYEEQEVGVQGHF